MWTCPKCGRQFKRTAQDHYCGRAPATIDAYIAQQPQALQPMLVQLRNAIHQAIPEAEETISWHMPTWKRKRNVMHFAVNKHHIGVYAGEDAIAHFAERLAGFETSKGALHLPFDREIPLSLIADMAKWSYEKA